MALGRTGDEHLAQRVLTHGLLVAAVLLGAVAWVAIALAPMIEGYTLYD